MVSDYDGGLRKVACTQRLIGTHQWLTHRGAGLAHHHSCKLLDMVMGSTPLLESIGRRSGSNPELFGEQCLAGMPHLMNGMLMCCCLLTLCAVQLSWQLWPNMQFLVAVLHACRVCVCVHWPFDCFRLASAAAQLSSRAVCLAAPQRCAVLRGNAHLGSAARPQKSSRIGVWPQPCLIFLLLTGSAVHPSRQTCSSSCHAALCQEVGCLCCVARLA